MRILFTVLVVLAGILSTSSAAVPTAAPTEHVTKVYEVMVTSSFGSHFQDCFRFSSANGGELNIDLLMDTLVYRGGGLDTLYKRFKATSMYGSIAFFGNFLSSPDRIKGEAVNGIGDTFTFAGKRNELCSATLSLSTASGSNPYLRESN